MIALGPLTEATPVAFADALPAACDLVIIGGGIIGVSAALFAAERGLKVVLCEKGRIAGEQSSRNWGWVRQQGRDLGELPIAMESGRLWRELDARIGGDRLGYRQTGILKASRDAAHLARSEGWLAQARAFGVDTRMISAAEMRELAPGSSVAHVGGMLTPSDGRAEPGAATTALARLAQSLGVVLRENCAVRGLDLVAGRVAGVETEAGPIRADQVILAGGSWSRLFLHRLGVRIPQLSVLASVAVTAPINGAPFAGGFGDGSYAFRTRADGSLLIGPGSEHDFFIGPDAFRSFFDFLKTLRQDFRSTTFRPWPPKGYPDGWTTARRWSAESPFEAVRVLSPRPNAAALERARAAMARTFPALADLGISGSWAGMIDTLPDVVPVIDRVPQIPGLILATGMGGHGFGIGPGFGRVLADLALERAPGHDLVRFRFGRFSDGSPVDFGAAI